MTTRITLASMAALAVCLTLLKTVQAQINAVDGPSFRMEKKPAPSAVPVATSSTSVPYNRLMEIMVELAWLADPLTSPCQLEAKVKGATLHVHGKLPDSAARDQALQLARVNCPMKVIDELKIAGGRPDKVTHTDAASLLQAAAAALREGFPSCHQDFRLQASADGKIIIEGPVQGFEQKLALSRALRRVRGCTCVANAVTLPGQSNRSLPLSPASPPRTVEAPKNNASSADVIVPRSGPGGPLVRIRPRSRSRFRALLCLPGNCQANPRPVVTMNAAAIPVGNTVTPGAASSPPIQHVAHSEPVRKSPPPRPGPPALDFKAGPVPEPAPTGQPYESRGVVVVPDGDPAAISAHQLKERITRVAGPGNKNIHVFFTSPTDVQIQLRAHSPAEAAQMAQVIMQIPELLSYRVDIRVQLVREDNRR